MRPRATLPDGMGYRPPVGRTGSRPRTNVEFNYHICIGRCMPSRNIAVQRTVYEALEREKRTGDSFTTVIRRLLDQQHAMDDLFGAWGRPSRSDRAQLRLLRRGSSA